MTNRKDSGRKYGPVIKQQNGIENSIETASTGEATTQKTVAGAYPGTGSAKVGVDAGYYNAPPAETSGKANAAFWQHFGLGDWIAIVTAIVVIAIFFVRLDWNVSSVHDDVKDVKSKVERLETNVTQQGRSLESTSTSVRELAQDTRRNRELLDDIKQKKH